MKYRKLGKSGIKVSEISLGTWQVGGKWGSGFDDALAEHIINEAIDAGVNFIDTADVYEAGASEAAVGRVVKSRSEEVFVATKCGRQINPHVNEGYTIEVLRKYVEDSLKNTGLDCLDLIQLHCPPTEVYYRPEIFELFDRLKDEGKIKNLGVSVEKVEEGLKAIEYPNVNTVQIIFNMFRQRPSELFFEQVRKKDVGVIVRVPLASGLLTGKFSSDSIFDKDDHRNFNRDGAAFDKGETFSGVPFDVGLQAVDELKKVFPQRENLAPMALRWILDFPEVSCIIPGASKVEHLKSNLEAAELPQLTKNEKSAVNEIYDKYIKKHVHQLW
jgi:aryl-alcohol dehydrogenase-like predicted oxidoreductase